MIIGFTGSRRLPTQLQRDWLRQELMDLQQHAEEFHHGDCIGADTVAHGIAKSLGIPVHIHPPVVDAYRAFLTGYKMYEPLPYLVRNQAIVRTCDVLYAMPDGPERLRSGTWYTIRQARRMDREVRIILPRGTAVTLD